ncbi:small RNA degrading nuclease 3-like [Dorcoceras hygrometricum]|uniref:Small RNA degrading nuclease 3-like n=1 Tax=Dorcoceras hygrometricum TaxID=472368 RepID=A0A2Z7C121_9LAMI|nr:small RNA degrading nuclease 3-like [Dorcoceras hygrometricum]
MDEIIASAKKEVLVEMVKLAQKKEMAGSKGQWKDFLKVYDKKFGTSLSDPSRRNIESLDAFLKTFAKSSDLEFFKKVLQCHSNRDKVEQYKKTSPDDETAEQKLVRLSLMHPQYPIDYCLPSYEEEWLVKKCSKNSRIMKSTEMIAIDCEMVLCEDGTEALVKVCAVDRNLQVKLDTVVKPRKAIADYRTEITGISATDLDGVTCTLPDVQQKSMKKILAHGTILVGHSLYNDLQALKLDHARVIDTSYIFGDKNGPTRKKPSLSLLCKAKLGYELRKPGSPHNCLDDACAAMKLVLARLEGRVDGVIPEEVKELDAGRKELGAGRLFVHRIPINVLIKDLQEVIPGNFTLQMKTSKKNTYSAFVIFKDIEEANEAFENLEGDLEKDLRGQPQKLVKFELASGLSGSLYVCKSIHDDSVKQLQSRKREDRDEDISGTLKKSRTDQTCGPILETDQCEVQLEEIQKLKEELNHRDQEISNLNRIIAALIRKQGL